MVESKNDGQQAVAEEPLSTQQAQQNQRSLFTHIWQGGLLCLVIGIIDNLFLQLGANFGWTGWTSYLAFGLFVAQTTVLSVVVGSNTRGHWVWWAFFAWSIGLVNLQLLLVNFNASRTYFSAFVYAFYSAQIGLIIFWAICGSFPRHRVRLPIASVAFAMACHPFWFSNYNRIGGWSIWLTLLTFFIVASTLTFGVLRFFGFQLVLPDLANMSKDDQGPLVQFGIKHLLIWTTIVAVLFGVGGAVDWESLLNNVLRENAMISSSSGRTLLLTVILVAVIWGVLGETKLVVARIGVLMVFLLMLSAALYFLDLYEIKKRGVSFAVGWVWTGMLDDRLKFDMAKIWTLWTILNGSFLASLFLVFRVGGFRFIKPNSFRLADFARNLVRIWS